MIQLKNNCIKKAFIPKNKIFSDGVAFSNAFSFFNSSRINFINKPTVIKSVEKTEGNLCCLKNNNNNNFLTNWGNLIRFNKPTGTYLLVLPCYWGSALGVSAALSKGAIPAGICAPFIPLHLFAIFASGAFLARSGGCIVNDMWDRDLDRCVERSKDRPLASNVLNLFQAFSILMFHFVLASLLLLALPTTAIYCVFCTLPVVIIYPLMKRIINAPQVVLGVCFNSGIFVGYAAVMDSLDMYILGPIYFAAICWTVLYDTIYAYQDKKDDIRIGVKSTTMLFGNSKKPLYFLMIPIVVGFSLTGYFCGMGSGYWYGLIPSFLFLGNIVRNVNINVGSTCAKGFSKNVIFALLILFSLFLGNLNSLLKQKKNENKEALHQIFTTSNPWERNYLIENTNRIRKYVCKLY